MAPVVDLDAHAAAAVRTLAVFETRSSQSHTASRPSTPRVPMNRSCRARSTPSHYWSASSPRTPGRNHPCTGRRTTAGGVAGASEGDPARASPRRRPSGARGGARRGATHHGEFAAARELRSSRGGAPACPSGVGRVAGSGGATREPRGRPRAAPCRRRPRRRASARRRRRRRRARARRHRASSASQSHTACPTFDTPRPASRALRVPRSPLRARPPRRTTRARRAPTPPSPTPPFTASPPPTNRLRVRLCASRRWLCFAGSMPPAAVTRCARDFPAILRSDAAGSASSLPPTPPRNRTQVFSPVGAPLGGAKAPRRARRVCSEAPA